jgi:hypothetical protein
MNTGIKNIHIHFLYLVRRIYKISVIKSHNNLKWCTKHGTSFLIKFKHFLETKYIKWWTGVSFHQHRWLVIVMRNLNITSWRWRNLRRYFYSTVSDTQQYLHIGVMELKWAETDLCNGMGWLMEADSPSTWSWPSWFVRTIHESYDCLTHFTVLTMRYPVWRWT